MLTVAAFLVISFLVASVSGDCKTPFNDCGSTHMKITSISVPGCCGPPCVLKRGTNATVTIDFTTDKTYATITQKLCGEIKPTCIGLTSLPPDFCKYTTCPIEAGKAGTAKIELPILKIYPPITLVGNWTFYGPDDTAYVGCFEVPLQLE